MCDWVWFKCFDVDLTPTYTTPFPYALTFYWGEHMYVCNLTYLNSPLTRDFFFIAR